MSNSKKSDLADKKQAPCFHSHPPISLGGGVIYGGSCIHPIVEDADIYVGLDMGMPVLKSSFPWNGSRSVLFPITNMQPPKDPVETLGLATWLWAFLKAGSSVHIGCQGGHGRTGIILAILVRLINEDRGAIEWVRKYYCPKAVETEAQVDWLVKHFDMDKAKPRWSQQDLALAAKPSPPFGGVGYPTGQQSKQMAVYPPEDGYGIFSFHNRDEDRLRGTWGDLALLPDVFVPDTNKKPIWES